MAYDKFDSQIENEGKELLELLMDFVASGRLIFAAYGGTRHVKQEAEQGFQEIKRKLAQKIKYLSISVLSAIQKYEDGESPSGSSCSAPASPLPGPSSPSPSSAGPSCEQRVFSGAKVAAFTSRAPSSSLGTGPTRQPPPATRSASTSLPPVPEFAGNSGSRAAGGDEEGAPSSPGRLALASTRTMLGTAREPSGAALSPAIGRHQSLQKSAGELETLVARRTTPAGDRWSPAVSATHAAARAESTPSLTTMTTTVAPSADGEASPNSPTVGGRIPVPPRPFRAPSALAVVRAFLSLFFPVLSALFLDAFVQLTLLFVMLALFTCARAHIHIHTRS